jgi:hypothetical protein
MNRLITTVCLFRRTLAGGLSYALLAATCAVAAQPNPTNTLPATNAPARGDYSNFRIVADRNIFNPRRYPSRTTRPRDERPQRTSRVDYFTLLGTMNYEKGPVAFFDGSRSDYHKTVQPGDTIGQYKVADIDLNGVLLDNGTNQTPLAVGKQLRREEEGAWHTATPEPPPESSYTRPSYSSSAPPAPVASAPATNVDSTNATERMTIVLDPSLPPVTIEAPGEFAPGAAPTNAAPETTSTPGADNDVLRRLMQRREQENNR